MSWGHDRRGGLALDWGVFCSLKLAEELWQCWRQTMDESDKVQLKS